MGTFAEIQCDYDMVVEGENFLSCSESTQWDYPLPKCVIKTTTEDVTVQNPSNSNTPKMYDKDDTSTEDNDDLIVETPKAPTMPFWQSLKKFLYQGCHSLRNTSSELCWKISKPIDFTDLSTFQPPETNEPMDKILVRHLQRCVNNLNKFSFSQKLTFENVFDCITNWENPATMSSDVKDSLRLIVCFYIDTVSLTSDQVNSAVKAEESITDQIKRYLTRIVTVVFQNYVRDASYNIFTEADDSSTKTTEMTYESKCNLMFVPAFPNNTFIKNVTIYKPKLSEVTVDLDNIRSVPVLVSELSKVHFECVKGYQLIGKEYSECLFGEWTDLGFDCERKIREIYFYFSFKFLKETIFPF